MARSLYARPPSGATRWERLLRADDAANDAWWTARAADASTVWCLRPSYANHDVTGLTTWSGFGIRDLCPDGGAVIYSTGAPASSVSSRITGSLTIRAIYYGINGTATDYYLAECIITGETEATNALWSLTRDDTGIVTYFHEYSALATNATITWNIGAGEGDVVYVALERTDVGAGSCEVRLYASVNGAAMTLVDVATVSNAVDEGYYATCTGPTGGTSSVVVASEGSEGQGAVTFLQLLSTTTTLAAEQAILTGLAG